MGRKPFKTPDEKLAIVLSVLKGELTQVEAARRLQMSQTTIAKWQKQFLESGREGLARGEQRLLADHAQATHLLLALGAIGDHPVTADDLRRFLAGVGDADGVGEH
ncbi:MAG: helix-turn-helix domain-containing protein, partial [Chloroflexi bacterium]|nr:helix-turn-helix domain-containing protein [Chloroflexota bacterium]